MVLDNITDLDELRKLREEIDNKIQDLKKQEQEKKVELAAKQFVGKYIKQYDCESYIDHYIVNQNKYTIYQIVSVHNITNTELLCVAHVIEIDYDKNGEEEVFANIEDDADLHVYYYTTDCCRIDLSQDYEEISREQAEDLVLQTRKDIDDIANLWFTNTQQNEENLCSKN